MGISLGSNTGTDLINLQGSTLEWSSEQVSMVNTVSGSIAQGVEVDSKQFDESFALLVKDFDSSRFGPVGGVITDAFHQANKFIKLRIVGFMVEFPDFAETLLMPDSNGLVDFLSNTEIERILDIINVPSHEGKIEGLLNFLGKRFGIVSKSDTLEMETAVNRAGIATSAGSADPVLDNILDMQDENGLKELILNAANSETLATLSSRLTAYPSSEVLPLLNKLLMDPQVGADCFKLMSQGFGSGDPQETVALIPGGGGERTNELHEMDREALEQLLLSPVSPSAFAQSYYPPAFCSHMMGLLAEE